MSSQQSSEDEAFAEVSRDLGLTESVVRETFARWLGHEGCEHPDLSPAANATCYAIYRLAKQKSAFRGVVASRERWRDAAHRAGVTTVASGEEQKP